MNISFSVYYRHLLCSLSTSSTTVVESIILYEISYTNIVQEDGRRQLLCRDKLFQYCPSLAAAAASFSKQKHRYNHRPLSTWSQLVSHDVSVLSNDVGGIIKIHNILEQGIQTVLDEK